MDNDSIAFHISDRVFTARTAMNDLAQQIVECDNPVTLSEVQRDIEDIAEVAEIRLRQVQSRINALYGLALPVAS